MSGREIVSPTRQLPSPLHTWSAQKAGSIQSPAPSPGTAGLQPEEGAALAAERLRVRAAALASPRTPSVGGSASRGDDADGVADELARVRKAARLQQRQPDLTPPRAAAPSAARLAAAVAADPPSGAVGQLQRAISGREQRAQRLLQEKDARLAQQTARLAELEAKMQELRSAHARQVATLEARAASVQGRAAASSVPSSAPSNVEQQLEQAEAANAELLVRLQHAERRASAAEQSRDQSVTQAVAACNEARQSSERTQRQLRERGDSIRFSREESLAEQLARERAETAMLRTEFVGAAEERETAARAVQELKQQMASAKQRSEALVRSHRSEADRAAELLRAEKLQTEDLREQIRRLQGRDGSLEARIVELELAGGIAREEAASEERQRAAGEAQALQERHREQSRRDAEQIGRLRGQLTAAEARAELAESRAAAMDLQLAAAREAQDEAQQVRALAASQCEVRSAQLEKAEQRVGQLERSLADSRALLGRQTGQLQAVQDRAAASEAQLAELQQRVADAELAAMQCGAEAEEGRAATERHTAELHKVTVDCASTEERLRAALRRQTELEAELSAAAAQLSESTARCRQAEERASGLEAALAAQVASLRQQLSADVEAVAAQRHMRERAAWEASALELDCELQTACRRRRRQARSSADAVAAAVLRARLAVSFAMWTRWADRRTAAGATRQRDVTEEALDCVRRRELQLQDEAADALGLADEHRRRLLTLRVRAAAVLEAGAVERQSLRPALAALTLWRAWLMLRQERLRSGDEAAAAAVAADEAERRKEAEAALRSKLQAARQRSADALLAASSRSAQRRAWRALAGLGTARAKHETAVVCADQQLRRRHCGEASVAALGRAAADRLLAGAWRRWLLHHTAKRTAKARTCASRAVRVVSRHHDRDRLLRAYSVWLAVTAGRATRAGSLASADGRRRRLALGGTATGLLWGGARRLRAAACWLRWTWWMAARRTARYGRIERRRVRVLGSGAAGLRRQAASAIRGRRFNLWLLWVQKRRAAGGSLQREQIRRSLVSSLALLSGLHVRSTVFRQWLELVSQRRAARMQTERRVLASKTVQLLSDRSRRLHAAQCFTRWLVWWAAVRAEAAACCNDAMRGLQCGLALRAVSQLAAMRRRATLQRCFGTLRSFAALTRMAELQTEADGLADAVRRAENADQHVRRRLQQTRSAASGACAGAVETAMQAGCFAKWLRWLCLRNMAAAEAGLDAAREDAQRDRTEMEARVAELESELEAQGAESAVVAARCEELTAEAGGLGEHTAMLDRALQESRDSFQANTADLLARAVRLEADRDRAMAQLEQARADAGKWQGEAEAGVRAAEELFKSRVASLDVEAAELRAARSRSERETARMQQQLQLAEDNIHDLQLRTAEADAAATAAQVDASETRTAMQRAADEAADERSALQAALAESHGEVKELHAQVAGRTQEQSRLSAELESVTAALAREADRRQALERALDEARRGMGSETASLAAQLREHQLRVTSQAAALEEARQRTTKAESQCASLRGQLKQVQRNREILGPVSELGRVSDSAEYQARCERLQTELEGAASTIQSLERKLRAAGAVDVKAALGDDIDELQMKAAQLRAEEARLDERVRSLRAERDLVAGTEASGSAPPEAPFESPFGGRGSADGGRLLRWIFDYADADRDGVLNYDELYALAQATGGELSATHYTELTRYFKAPQGLRIEHLRALYSQHMPGDLEDHYARLSEQAPAAH